MPNSTQTRPEPRTPPRSALAASDHVYQRVSHEIQEGVLAPGELLTERDLAERYEVSRTPVREALARLEKGQWVERDSRGRALVSAPSLEQMIDDMVAREALEGMAARLASQRPSPAFETQLRALHDEGNSAAQAGDIVRAIQISSRWHTAIWQAAGNATLFQLLSDLESSMGGRFRRSGLNDPDRLQQGSDEHQAVIDAILTGDPDAAESEMRQHIRRGLEVRVRLFMAAGSGGL